MKLKLLFALSVTFVSQLVLASQQSKEIESVENGLRALVSFEGDPVWRIEDRMQHYGVPGMSIAVIKDFRIYWVKHYGIADRETNQPVNSDTLFQAASISKPVAAYAALKLVEDKKLSLDSPVNEHLVGWKIPDNDFTKKQPVALKHLLNHSAGLTVSGFDGYSVDESVPNIHQILNGESPANSAPIRVDILPESEPRYSGGGYTIVQKLVSDVTNSDYPNIMNKLVLLPLAMSHSSFEQPLPEDKLKHAATGHLPNKLQVIGKRHTYPELAAAGLWTTAEDLAKFAIDVQMSIKADKGQVLSQSMANKMTTRFLSSAGLGFFILSKNDDIYFGHNGWNEGFSSDLIAHKTEGFGVVIMTNSNHPAFIEELKNSVAATYQWANYVLPKQVALPISKKEQQRVIGRYKFHTGMLFNVYAENDRLFMQYLNGTSMEIFRIGENQYVRRQNDRRFRFEQLVGDDSVSFIFGINNEVEHVRRRMKEGDNVPFEFVMDGEFEQAKIAYSKLLRDKPEHKTQAESTILNYADKLKTASEREKALSVYQLATFLFSTANSFVKLASFHERENDRGNALISFKKALAIDPENPTAKEAIDRLEN